MELNGLPAKPKRLRLQPNGSQGIVFHNEITWVSGAIRIPGSRRQHPLEKSTIITTPLPARV
jgi:hypothetical protein